MSATSVLINQINTATTTVVSSILSINFILGSVSLIFNIIIFTRPKLRQQPCSIYFLTSSYLNLFVIYIVLPVRIVSSSFNVDLANYNLIVCKIEFFLFFAVRATACWAIVFACVDRYFHSSSHAKFRRLSSLKIAKITVIIGSIIVSISYSHMLVYYIIKSAANQYGNVIPLCTDQNGNYATFIAFWHMMLYSLGPTISMFLFGCLTLYNLRTRRQIVPLGNETNRNIRRTDNQLLKMLAGQIFVIVIARLPSSFGRIYISLTQNIPKDTLRIAQENLALKTLSAVAYLTHSTTFYLYTLSGTLFRKEFWKLIRKICHFKNNNRRTKTTRQTQQLEEDNNEN
ncbi:unnamed protein product [Adineta ricciae]|uniref:G-protein coupled receptors family 1 profile domain-containing protein n=1 Tax=Adineta ricciae TaxID=249248 RepID=A0A816DLZ6_ADIRI|nr:unnamed protein product [Adineta ricciae]CAF1636475.1 unnamed protein product [Adineta ricciae]